MTSFGSTGHHLIVLAKGTTRNIHNRTTFPLLLSKISQRTKRHAAEVTAHSALLWQTMPFHVRVLHADSTGEQPTELESIVSRKALTAQHLARSFQRGTERRSVIRRAERGERLKPRVARWPDKAAACLYLSLPGQQKQHSSRIQIGSSNGACSIRRARALPSFGSEMCCSARREGIKTLLRFSLTLREIKSALLAFDTRVSRLSRGCRCHHVSSPHLVGLSRRAGKQRGHKVAVEARRGWDDIRSY